KPMIEIGGKPILWHIMKIYATQGFNEFIVCLGYKGEVIKNYFLNYYNQSSNFTIDLGTGHIDIHSTDKCDFKVTLVETGLETKTAGRLRRVKEFLGKDDFMLTYGDGVSNINLAELIKFHKMHGKLATLTSVKPEQNFGRLQMDDQGKVTRFREKSQEDAVWINGGFFVLKHEVFNYIPNDSDNMMWEDEPLDKLTTDGQLHAYKHEGFWKCMDAMRDKIQLDELWATNNAKWKIW
ncbi:MAG TPA: glucose-1-phosphate cytidylyltransferase, partial [Bacteroidia bacterium]